MIAFALATLVLGATALIVLRNRPQPKERPVRVEAEERKDARRRR